MNRKSSRGIAICHKRFIVLSRVVGKGFFYCTFGYDNIYSEVNINAK